MQTQTVQGVQIMCDSESQAYTYRAFLWHIAAKLSQEDCKKIAFLACLPEDIESNLHILTLFTQLEMCGKLSATRLDDLANILKNIERHDLADMVKEFVKQQEGEKMALVLTDLDRTATNPVPEVMQLHCKTLQHQARKFRISGSYITKLDQIPCKIDIRNWCSFCSPEGLLPRSVNQIEHS